MAMLRTALVLTALLGVAACGEVQTVPSSPARLAQGALGREGNPDVAAVNLAQYAFADAARLYGRPAETARAAAALDYLAGQSGGLLRGATLSDVTRDQLLQARQEMRAALGVLPDAPSQLVVDRMLAAAAALDGADPAVAARQVAGPPFSLPPDQVLQRLSNPPYLRMANVATVRAASELLDSSPADPF